jgi:hypothetical protein
MAWRRTSLPHNFSNIFRTARIKLTFLDLLFTGQILSVTILLQEHIAPPIPPVIAEEKASLNSSNSSWCCEDSSQI